MASVSGVMSEEHFLCSICLDVFTEPVAIPCGHNFCKVCITQYWDSKVTCDCPFCKNHYGQRPDLCVNTLISEMASLYKKSPEGRPAISDSSHQDAVGPGEVPCDICPDAAKRRALKSCLVCLASFCETHLEPHRRVATCKKHKLIDPVVNLEARMCKNHGKLMEIFCRSDQECICVMCLKTEHKAHDTVLLEEEYKSRQAKLSHIKSDAQQMIWQRVNRVHHLKQLINSNNVEATSEKDDSIKVFSALAAAVQSNQVMLIEEIEERRRTAEENAQGFIKQLEQDIAVLQRKSTELELSSHSEDHHHLLQTFLSISSIPQVLELSKVNVQGSQSLKTVCKDVAQLQEMLHTKMEVVPKAKLRAQQSYAVDVTLDPATARSGLVLSEDGKQVRARRITSCTDIPFGECCVLSKLDIPAFSSKIYYEVQVKGNREWKLGVMEESFKCDRKQPVYWALQLEKEGNYSCHKNERDLYYPFIKPTTTPLSVSRKPKKIGVLVDYNGREVSFYDVDSGALLHRLRCKFQKTLYPMFWCNCQVTSHCDHDDANPAPLIITPVVAS